MIALGAEVIRLDAEVIALLHRGYCPSRHGHRTVIGSRSQSEVSQCESTERERVDLFDWYAE